MHVREARPTPDRDAISISSRSGDEAQLDRGAILEPKPTYKGPFRGQFFLTIASSTPPTPFLTDGTSSPSRFYLIFRGVRPVSLVIEAEKVNSFTLHT